MRSIDCETTGLDFHHGACPYLVVGCPGEGEPAVYWEWDVDPLTRQPAIPAEDVHSIWDYVFEGDILALQNPKFDVAALAQIEGGFETDWPWGITVDCLLGAHLLASNQPKDLTTTAMIYLGINIKPLEDAVKVATQEARRIARSRFPDWRIAREGEPDMPSAKEETWKFDMWLPRALALEDGYHSDHPWWTVLSDYACGDAVVTERLAVRMLEIIEQRGLSAIYRERLKCLPVAYNMEARGITIHKGRLEKLRTEYATESSKAGNTCVAIAQERGAALVLPKSGNNKSLVDFVFSSEGLALPAVKASKKTGAPSLDKTTLDHYIATMDEGTPQHTFVTCLRDKRKRDTALAYMEGYKRFWIPLDVYNNKGERLWYQLYPSLNPTGTDTLRWSSSNPNEQNISKQENFNLRYLFGPAPGREWWSMDAKNIELRIPAYESGEREMIDLFERPDDPPYYGSNHLLVFDVLHPEKFAQYGADVKKVFASTWYQWTKNGNFAVTYGAVEQSGTADRAYHIPGAQSRIKSRFSNIEKLNQKCIAFATKHGYVETLPDKTVSKRGYPLLCTRTRWDSILPTVPLNYHVSGTAMWWMMRAMIRCQEYLDRINDVLPTPSFFMVMQVHDELMFDFPKGKGKQPHLTNLPIVRELMRLMSIGGDDIGIPTPVSCEYHPVTWSEGITIKEIGA